jgi:hypothetical protein
MKCAIFAKILATAAIAGFASSSANAVVLTYTNLTCRYHGFNQSGDAVYDVIITNVGRGTVPGHATYTVTYFHPNKTFKVKLRQGLKPKQHGTASSPSSNPPPRSCRAKATWWVPTERQH